jgi:hypothetical protein
MPTSLTLQEQRLVERIAREPRYWLRTHVPEVVQWEDEIFDLLDRIKGVWEECQKMRVNLGFLLRLETGEGAIDSLSIREFDRLQKRQNQCNSSLIFEINLSGYVIRELDLKCEIEPVSLMVLSQERQAVFFWLGPDFRIYCKGYLWDDRNMLEILKEIKSKKRDRFLSMNDYHKVLDTHFAQYLRDEARELYWFPGKKNQVLQALPERIFQKSLWEFIDREVEGQADREPMFKDESRCDIRVFVDYDLYFIEVKWIGRAAKRLRDRAIVTAETEELSEFDVDRAIGGAYQTKRYIEKNNSVEYDNRIKLGILVVYDAYPEPRTPINYGDEIVDFPLLGVKEYQLVSRSPSVETKDIAKRKGLA